MANKKVTPLTDTEIKKLKPKFEENKDYTISDGNGLQLLVKLDGRKIWEIRYTIHGKAKKTTLGSYPAVTLAKARSIR
ncbi:integrase arm-type DNA-binding domain-containing protein, partial [Sulfuricurvum sp.]|uniref:integrase arm-type DNA-binding domain-containing protein n=1 Tax=Sulfuricurvum sp. TaxID=2025608 RepID=UPI0025CCC850